MLTISCFVFSIDLQVIVRRGNCYPDAVPAKLKNSLACGNVELKVYDE